MIFLIKDVLQRMYPSIQYANRTSENVRLFLVTFNKTQHFNRNTFKCTACALSGHLRRVTYKEPDAVCIQ